MEMIRPKTFVGVTPSEFSLAYPRLYPMAHKDGWLNRGKTHLVLTIDTCRLIRSYEQKIALCAMNSGNIVPFAQKRVKLSFMKMSDSPFQARRERGPYYTVVELAVDTDIPDILDYVTSVDYMPGGQREFFASSA